LEKQVAGSLILTKEKNRGQKYFAAALICRKTGAKCVQCLTKQSTRRGFLAAIAASGLRAI
jgi:hypothetical protein